MSVITTRSIPALLRPTPRAHVPQIALREPGELAELMRDLYAKQQSETPGDAYLAGHAHPSVIRTQVSVYQWYREYLPQVGTVLDWGCRHAPDACLIRAGHPADDLELHGCDIDASDRYFSFHSSADLAFKQLGHVSELPYANDTFDAVIGSGTLEHVAMDYESLKELYRVLKPGGKLIITYLPNRWSYEEWWRRNIWKAGAHLRLYTAGELQMQMLRTGLKPLTLGYQNRYDMLAQVNPPRVVLRHAVRVANLHRITSTLCVVAEKVNSLM